MLCDRRRPSPAQIRARAALVVRNRIRGVYDTPRLPELRAPEADETPLSAAEVHFAVELGVVAPSARNFA